MSGYPVEMGPCGECPAGTSCGCPGEIEMAVMAASRINGPRPPCAVCGDEATHSVGSRSLCPDHAAA